VIAVALALALVQEEPALKPAARLKEGAFVCDGTTDLPDDARLTVSVRFPFTGGAVTLATQNITVKENKFEIELPVFGKEPFPGSYTVSVVFDPMLQKSDLGRAFAIREIPVEAPGDVDHARRLFFGELRRAVDELDKLRKELPADWKDKAAAAIQAILARPEAKLTGVMDHMRDAFENMYEALEEISGRPAEERAKPSEQYDACRKTFLETLDSLSSDPLRALTLLDQLEEALKAGKPAAALVLALGGVVGEPHQVALTGLAMQIQDRNTKGALETIADLRRKLTPVTSPK
jgi:hypothetical protein